MDPYTVPTPHIRTCSPTPHTHRPTPIHIHVAPPPTFAMSLRVLSVFWSGCSSLSANSLGERMAGTKNLRNKKPVMAR